MKIGIVTFHSAHNYGAVLQAWSLQEYLKQQGHEVEIVNLRLNVIDRIYRLTYKTNRKVCSSQMINNLVNSAYYYMRRGSYWIKEPGKNEKYRKFEHFIKHKLPVTKEVHTLNELQNLDLHYDALIAGSDQIWNPFFSGGKHEFLGFVPKEKRLSFAAIRSAFSRY